MAGLPIVKMTLYKHGVGFYQRRGTLEDTAVTLVFEKTEMNDVLKSLTAFTVDEGQVLSVDYETPEDKAARLARSSIHLSDAASLRDLLRDLRGRSVEVRITPGSGGIEEPVEAPGSRGSETAVAARGPGTTRTLRGVVVGVDLPPEREPMSATLLSVLIADGATVEPIRLADVLSLKLTDSRAAEDLTFFLNTSLAEENKRAVTVRLSPGKKDLIVSYIAPSPTWRVSYRLVADTAEGHPTALLQGWGLFDNTFDENLNNVQVTLVAGMPVSFIYDLYAPFTPQRPVVREQARTVAGPVEFDQAYAEEPEGLAAEALLVREGAPRAFGATAALAAAPAARMKASDLGRSTAVAATGQAQGEFFSYVVTHPVTVQRGRSAMVPILQAQVNYRKERIYSAAKHPLNPIITARFKNGTGWTLERGPMTVIEGGEYAGEAVVPFSGTGAEISLAYAVDLGVKVAEEPSSEQVLASVNIEKRLLVVNEYNVQRIRYRIENNNDSAVDVTIEHPRLPNYSPFETAQPAESTADAYRYVVSIKPHSVGTFTAAQRRLVARREEIRSQRLEQLRRWLRDRVLDEKTFGALQEVLALYEQITESETRLKENETRRQEIFSQQKAIQANLTSLKDQGEEGQLRARYVRTLNQQEDTLAQLKASDDDLRRAIERTKEKIEAVLKEF